MKKQLFGFLFFFYTIGTFAQNNPILHLSFNGNANDLSGNGNHGTVHNATLTADRNGNPNGAYDFNGVDSFIDFPASPSLLEVFNSQQVTVTAWINIRNWYQGWNVFPIIEQYNPQTDYGSLVFEANWAAGGILFTSGYNYMAIGCNYSWNFNTWHHVAVTYDKANAAVKFYLDGNLTCNTSYSQDFSEDDVNSFAIGRSLSGPDEYSDGKIDDIAIYNKALTQSEIQQLLSAEDIAKKALILYPNPVAEYLNIENYQDASVKIFSIEGKLVFSGQIIENKIDLSKLSAGIYNAIIDGKPYKIIKK